LGDEEVRGGGREREGRREEAEGDYLGGCLRRRLRARKMGAMVTMDTTTMNEAKARWMFVEFDRVIVSQVMSQRTSDHVMSSMMFNGVTSCGVFGIVSAGRPDCVVAWYPEVGTQKSGD
jgi:hypothetical protein